jgi:hypothetical protein
MAALAGPNYRAGGHEMAICKECGNETDELKTVSHAGKKKKMCEDCADRKAEEGAIAEESESVVQNMMGFKGRR